MHHVLNVHARHTQVKKAFERWIAYLEEVLEERACEAQELARQQLEEAAKEKQTMAEAEAERRIEMCKRVVQRMLRHQLLMAWNMFVETVIETRHNRETVRKVLSRMQHRQLAQVSATFLTTDRSSEPPVGGV